MLTPGSLFNLLDLNRDGDLSRSELHTAATRLGWHWNEAPLLALLDLLTIYRPLPHDQFLSVIQQIQGDPMGIYGRVLLNSPHFDKRTAKVVDPNSDPAPAAMRPVLSSAMQHPRRPRDLEKVFIAALKRSSGNEIANGYRHLLDSLDTCHTASNNAALLIIDPQRSFTAGDWMQSIGRGAEVDVEPISIAFESGASVLRYLYGTMEIMFTRCPFPPGSYNWDKHFAKIIADHQLYVIKPGKNVLFPPLNGFREWARRCIGRGIKTMVVGGCTLTSCVRVSSIEIRQAFKNDGLRVVVDLAISGARRSNYIPSPHFGGLSAVASAVDQMIAAGVQVVRRVAWHRTSSENTF